MITYDEHRKLYVYPDPLAPKFKELVAGVGWMDPTGSELELFNWAVVIGHREDGEYELLEEICTNLSDLCEKLTDAKDRWLVKRIFCDRSNLLHLEKLSKHDGLVEYFHEGTNQRGQKMWLHESHHWPNFRSRERIALIPLSERITADILSAAELVDRLSRSGKLGVRSCPRLDKIMGLSPGEIVKHPAIRALAYPLIALEREKASEVEDSGGPEIIYHNLERR